VCQVLSANLARVAAQPCISKTSHPSLKTWTCSNTKPTRTSASSVSRAVARTGFNATAAISGTISRASALHNCQERKRPSSAPIVTKRKLMGSYLPVKSVRLPTRTFSIHDDFYLNGGVLLNVLL
jgi:hypothetical protein